jgi:hypothetical protein
MAQRLVPRPLIIYSSFLGGTLATSLALTESWSSSLGDGKMSILGLIVKDGVFDWTRVATSKDPLSNTNQEKVMKYGDGDKIWKEAWDTQSLHNMKKKLFKEPASAFDTFASPLLFFRTAGISVPKWWVGEKRDPAPAVDHTLLDGLSLSPEEVQELKGVDTPSPIRSSQNQVKEEELEVSRQSYLKFPPKDSGLRIPRAVFYTSSPISGNIAEDEEEERERQARELVNAMQRSVRMYEFKEKLRYGRQQEDDSEERVQYLELDDAAKEEEIVREFLENTVDTVR